MLTFWVAIAMMGFVGVGSVAGVEKSRKPNIIVVLADDLGYTDVGCYGCKDYPTPHLDSLAKNGVRFTHGYAGGPWCAPSRHSLLFGSQGARGGAKPPLNLAQLLKAAGYRTAIIGKVHGHTIAARRSGVSFD